MSRGTHAMGAALLVAGAIAACRSNKAAAPAQPAATGDAPTAEAPQPDIRTVGTITWTDFAAPGFDPGMKITVLHGDPGTNGDYTLRLRFPDGYRFPPHWHPMGEHATVLSGTLLLGMGERVDQGAVKTYQAGDFAYLPAKMPHFGGVKGETTLQLHGVGPFQVVLVSPTK